MRAVKPQGASTPYCTLGFPCVQLAKLTTGAWTALLIPRSRCVNVCGVWLYIHVHCLNTCDNVIMLWVYMYVCMCVVRLTTRVNVKQRCHFITHVFFVYVYTVCRFTMCKCVYEKQLLHPTTCVICMSVWASGSSTCE